MIITKITLRRLAIDSSPFYNGLPVPKDEKSVWEFPLVSIETDAGLTGYSMGYGTSGQGHGMAQALLDTYAHLILGENPFAMNTSGRRSAGKTGMFTT